MSPIQHRAPAQRTTGSRASSLGHLPNRGRTLVEALVVVVVTLVLVVNAMPQLQQLRQRQMLTATAATLETQVRYARTMAQALDAPVRLTVLAVPTSLGTGNCTLVHTGPANACTCDGRGHARCSAGTRLLQMSEHISRRDGASITNIGRSLVFAPGKGTVTPTATFTVAARDGRSLNEIVNIVGRVRSCSNSKLPGIPACS